MSCAEKMQFRIFYIVISFNVAGILITLRKRKKFQGVGHYHINVVLLKFKLTYWVSEVLDKIYNLVFDPLEKSNNSLLKHAHTMPCV